MNILPFLPPDDQVLQWLLEVARRADASTRPGHLNREADRRIWLRAELEVFERAERVTPRMPLMSAS